MELKKSNKIKDSHRFLKRSESFSVNTIQDSVYFQCEAHPELKQMNIINALMRYQSIRQKGKIFSGMYVCTQMQSLGL